jgi:hypothetical protein
VNSALPTARNAFHGGVVPIAFQVTFVTSQKKCTFVMSKIAPVLLALIGKSADEEEIAESG